MKTRTIQNGDGTIDLPVAENTRDVMTLIRSDMYRTGTGWAKVLLRPFSHFGFLVWFRLCDPVTTPPLRLLAKVMHRLAGIRCKIDIPASVKAGYGLYLGHGMCMVVNGGTIIGNNVNLSQFLNIGTNHSAPPVIGDNVYIGPMVCIVEDVHIGSGATIGAGAVVSRDIPADATAVGAPARAVNFNAPARYIGRPWPMK